jgi:1,4-alpha-glucan branching enzyme
LNQKGYLSIILHAHLPFVKHPEEEFFLEENWLYEAISESYLPLYIAFTNLKKKGVKFQVTMSITPPLVAMLQDRLLLKRFDRYLKGRIDLLKEELAVNKGKEVKALYQFYYERYQNLYKVFNDELNGDLVAGFGKLFNDGFLELITCSATHELLPLEINNKVRDAQVSLGVEAFTRAFGREPRGIWLAECAYTESIDKILSKHGIKFTILDTHGILHAETSPVYGVSAPIISENGVAFFGRDPESSKQVWSALEGYPGDFNYREFYKDIGYELDEGIVKKYLHPAGFRFDSGIKLHKITGKVPLDKKELYVRNAAMEMVETHAGNFMFDREAEAKYLHGLIDREPIMLAPFDAELFGHWWFEGPDFLQAVFEKIYKYSGTIETITPYNYLVKYPVNQIAEPSTSSWGDGGYFRVWLNEGTDWIYPHLHVMGERMVSLARKYKNPKAIEKRLLNQMARELLLAESSDWAFLISVGTAVEYATSMEKFHINAFYKLEEGLNNKKINTGLLEYLEEKDSIFPFIDYNIFK